MVNQCVVAQWLGMFLVVGVFSSPSAIERHSRIAGETEATSKTKPVLRRASSFSYIQGFTLGWASKLEYPGIQAELLYSVEVQWPFHRRMGVITSYHIA
jgi:hypothetical protein